jgi:hypothetical protein
LITDQTGSQLALNPTDGTFSLRSLTAAGVNAAGYT